MVNILIRPLEKNLCLIKISWFLSAILLRGKKSSHLKIDHFLWKIISLGQISLKNVILEFKNVFFTKLGYNSFYSKNLSLSMLCRKVQKWGTNKAQTIIAGKERNLRMSLLYILNDKMWAKCFSRIKYQNFLRFQKTSQSFARKTFTSRKFLTFEEGRVFGFLCTLSQAKSWFSSKTSCNKTLQKVLKIENGALFSHILLRFSTT